CRGQERLGCSAQAEQGMEVVMRSLRSTTILTLVAGSLLTAGTMPASSGVLPTNVAALHNGDSAMVPVWYRGGWGHGGFGWGGLAAGAFAGALIAGAFASPYYGGYYGGYYPRYYAPAYSGYYSPAYYGYARPYYGYA